MYLIYCAYFHFTLHAQLVSGRHNQTADALSRNNLHLFFSLCPQAWPTPEPVPLEVTRTAMITKAERTLPVWRALFRAPSLFRFVDGGPLTHQRLVHHLHCILRATGVSSERFSSHSFRIGAATTAAACGIEDSLIKTLRRWESSAYQCYIRLPREKLVKVSTILCSQLIMDTP